MWLSYETSGLSLSFLIRSSSSLQQHPLKNTGAPPVDIRPERSDRPLLLFAAPIEKHWGRPRGLLVKRGVGAGTCFAHRGHCILFRAPAARISFLTKRGEVVRARRTEVIASRSELLSLHCPRHLLFLALLPACDGSQVIMRQDCSAYAAEPLRTAGLLEAAHQYSLQDMRGSARTPSPLNSLLRRDSYKTYMRVYIALSS